MKNEISTYLFVWKGRSNDDVGGARGTVFQEIRPELVSKPAILSNKCWGGYRRTTQTISINGGYSVTVVFSSQTDYEGDITKRNRAKK